MQLAAPSVGCLEQQSCIYPKIPRHLQATVAGECLFSDGIDVVIFTLMLSPATGTDSGRAPAIATLCRRGLDDGNQRPSGVDPAQREPRLIEHGRITKQGRTSQMEGIAAAKLRGVYKGRKPSIDATEIRRLQTEEKLGVTAIARRLGIGRASVYRLLGKDRLAGQGMAILATDVAAAKGWSRRGPKIR
jgi:hypothetical protein